MIDYDRVRDMKSKGDIPDKALQESADAYVSINGQLVDELPKFFELTAKYFDILTGGLALVQLKFYHLMQREWIKLVEQHLGMEAARSYEAIITKHMDQLDKVEEKASKITIMNRKHFSNSSTRSNNSSTSSLMLKQRSRDIYSPPRTIPDNGKLWQVDSVNSIIIKTVDITAFSPMHSGFATPSPQPRIANIPDIKQGDLIDLEQIEPVITSNDFECIVLYDFQTHEEDRLDVKRGTVLRVTQDENYIDQDWWFATTIGDDRSGWVPINYCKKL